jgi:hypothetical protein
MHMNRTTPLDDDDKKVGQHSVSHRCCWARCFRLDCVCDCGCGCCCDSCCTNVVVFSINIHPQRSVLHVLPTRSDPLCHVNQPPNQPTNQPTSEYRIIVGNTLPRRTGAGVMINIDHMMHRLKALRVLPRLAWYTWIIFLMVTF